MADDVAFAVKYLILSKVEAEQAKAKAERADNLQAEAQRLYGEARGHKEAARNMHRQAGFAKEVYLDACLIAGIPPINWG
jgi:hypothetical protein